MTVRRWTAIVGTLTVLLHAVSAAAQQADPRSRFEVSGGLGWVGASTMGSRDATLTAATGARFRLFSTSSDLASTPEIHVGLGGRVARTVDAEVTASFSRPVLQTTISADVEGASAMASVSTTQFVVEGGVRISPSALSIGPRVRLFVAAGGGYLRQLYEDKLLAETGQVVYAGGGVTIPFRQQRSPRSRAVGLRVDARAERFSGGIALDDSARIAPFIRGSIFATF